MYSRSDAGRRFGRKWPSFFVDTDKYFGSAVFIHVNDLCPVGRSESDKRYSIVSKG